MVFCVAGANRIDPARSVIWAGPVFPSGRMPESARTNVKSSKLQPKPLSTTPGPWRRLALILVLLGGSALIVWTSLGRWELPAIGSRQPDYYNLLVSGFRKGSLALDIDVPQLASNRFNIRGFVGIRSCRQATVKAVPRHTGERGEPLVLFGQRARGERTDRRRIQPAGEQATDRMGAP